MPSRRETFFGIAGSSRRLKELNFCSMRIVTSTVLYVHDFTLLQITSNPMMLQTFLI